MDVVLMILKILGIVILCVVAVLLVLALLILFVPFRYKYRLKYNDDNHNENCHYVDLTWLLKFIKLRVFISLSGVDYEVRILGIRCRFIEKLLKKTNKVEEDMYFDDDVDDDNQNLFKEDESSLENYSYEKSILPNYEQYDNLDKIDDRTILEKIIDGDLDEILDNNIKEEVLDNNIDSDSYEINNIESDYMEDTNMKNSISQEEHSECDNYEMNNDYTFISGKSSKLKKYYILVRRRICMSIKKIVISINHIKKIIVFYLKKIVNVLNPIKWLKILLNKIIKLLSILSDLISSIIDSIIKLIHKIDLIIEFLDKPSTIKGIEKVKQYVAVTCMHILPKKKKIVLNVGFDDPSETGQLLAVAGVMYPLLGQSIEIYPNFSDKEFKADCFLKGKIRCFNLIIIVIKVIKDKAIKRLIYNLNKLKEELDDVR